MIELLIVVAIVGILAAVAVPGYAGYSRRAQRTQARAMLHQAAQYMQTMYALHDRYDTAVLPATLQSPAGYTITIASADRTHFILRASPVGPMAADACGALTLDHTGLQGASGRLGANQCWR